MKFGRFIQFYAPFEPDFLKTEIGLNSYLSIEQIILLKNFLSNVQSLKEWARNTDVIDYFIKLHNYIDIVREIDSKIDQDNQVKDDASHKLYQIRKLKKGINNRMRNILNDILINRSNLFTSPNIVERNGHYVLPVKSNFKKDLPGLIHSYSNTGETVFIEPIEITDESARLLELDNREAQEIEAILQDLTNKIRANIDIIEQDIEMVISLDLLFAKARFAMDFSATRPVFTDHFNIINGIHPILKRINENVVPLNLNMNSNKKILLVSGPNAGGKTVVLKTVGLIVLMAKCGLFITAEEGSSIPFFEEVYADIGDEQSIESHLSTFAAHVKQIKQAIEGKEKSLILLDELMSQTSAEEGSALAAAIMEQFARRQSTVLATTHNEDLKIFVSKRDDMINGGMEFTDRPTYRLIIGIPQPSNALKLASQLGINSGIVEMAHSYLDKEKMSLNELFTDLSKELKSVQEERRELASRMREYEEKLSELNSKKKKDLEELKTKYKNELIQAKRTIDKLIKTLKKEGPKPQQIQETKKFFDEKLQVDEPRPPYYPKIGEIIKVIDIKRFGQVVAERQGKFKVSFENMYFWVEPSDIEAVEKG